MLPDSNGEAILNDLINLADNKRLQFSGEFNNPERLLAAGETKDQIIDEYPYLEPEDIDEALQYAACLAEDETVELTS